ncbi:TRAP transporter permease [Maledivibacter halophilus]|uniref:TRAP transporter, 4TM/12TM fusion protein n=1 Tax=Maledivibacter halophilus TaxID=36842 RepID=A0A1T5IRJ3_9FIRM|nr:TRAP transporter permease [Maledivibacter halophilus]SKC41804.1 TRAP transporter, 4TM/12TM fusion protein [Maledivibacter halophilus]
MFFKKKNKEENLSSEEKLEKMNSKFERTRELKGIALKIFTAMAIFMSLYHLYSSGIKMLPQIQHKAIHLSLALALTYFIFPGSAKQKKRLPWYDILCIVLSIAIGLYITLDYQNLIYRIGEPNTMDLFLGAAAIILVLEATRRTMGWPLVSVALVALGYAAFGHLIPGQLGHKAYSISRIIEHMFMTSEGIYGVAIYVTSTFVFIFILMGALLGETGGAQAFIDLAFSLTGRFRGGPAKAAIIGSGFMGTISGSSFANVAGTGTFTIPLMKSVGYKPSFAGGVEAAASSGGQIMPPIMGAAAFIMAEMTGVAYNKLIIYAIIPAVLYYISVFLMVDIEAAKLGLSGLSKEELPKISEVFKRGGLLLLAPLSIFYMLLVGYSPIKASFTAVIIVLVVSTLRKETRLNPKQLAIALEKGARGALSVIAACAVAGLIVGTVTLTGLGLKFADLIVMLANGNLYMALVLTMVASIIMGMGMPTTALYIILGSMVAPALVQLDVPIIAAHLFIFYFGCMAAVTPPVALSSYLAAAIAKADSVKTALSGLKLASSAFILPFVFALSPELILINTTPGKTVKVVISALIGIFALASSLEKHLFTKTNKYESILLFAAALMLIIPGIMTDIIGLALVAVIGLKKYYQRKSIKENSMLEANEI